MSSLFAAIALAGPASAALLPDWRDPVPARHASVLPATTGMGIGQLWAIHGPMLALGMLCLVVFVLYVQAVQLSVTRGEAFHQAQLDAERARVAEAAALRDTPRLLQRRMLHAAATR